MSVMVGQSDDLAGTTKQMWERACSRKRCVIQHFCRMTHRFREQARSHRFFAFQAAIAVAWFEAV
jgi:hypothetical protein